MTDNIVNVLKTVINASALSSTGRQNEAFWEDAMDMLLFNTIFLDTIFTKKDFGCVTHDLMNKNFTI